MANSDWSAWFAPYENAAGVDCDSLCCHGRAEWLFTLTGTRLCEDCYQRSCREMVPERCCYCERDEGLLVCHICGRACCPDHAWPMREEVKRLFGVADAIECVECVWK